MAAKKSGLGRSLSALLGPLAVESATAVTVKDKTQQILRQLPLEMIERSPYQPRREFTPEALHELADSIRQQGIIQPIVVRTLVSKTGYYELIAGERRWRAAQLVGLAEIPAIIHEVSDEMALVLGLIENIQRENLNAIEEAVALQRLHQEFALTHQQIAEAVGKSRTTVTNLLRLLNLDEEVKVLLAEKKLEMGHARALLALEPTLQRRVAQQVVAEQLSVRDTEKLASHKSTSDKQEVKTIKYPDPNINKFQEMLAEKLGARVAIQHNSSGKGKLTVYYNSVDELEGVLLNFTGINNP